MRIPLARTEEFHHGDDGLGQKCISKLGEPAPTKQGEHKTTRPTQHESLLVNETPSLLPFILSTVFI